MAACITGDVNSRGLAVFKSSEFAFEDLSRFPSTNRLVQVITQLFTVKYDL